MRPLVIAFIYDSFDSYRAQGFSVEQCQEFDTDETINATIRSLKACGHEVVPVPGIKKLVAMLAKGEHETWDLAFPTAEGMFGAGREAQVSGLLEAYQIPHVFSDAATLSLSHDKARTKVRISCLTNSPIQHG
jgi:D-alanine-D-alanine ligase-like ATP-grasp enzyme